MSTEFEKDLLFGGAMSEYFYNEPILPYTATGCFETITGTTTYLHCLVFVENIFCINRHYLFRSQKVRNITHLISLAAAILIVASIIYDVFVIQAPFRSNVALGILNFISAVELVFLALQAKRRKTFAAIDRLDEKCGIDEEYETKIKRKVKITTALVVVSVLLNFSLSIWQNWNLSVTVLLSLATSAHDAEMDMISLLIDGFNIRLSKLKGVTPLAGSRVYRHVLMTASNFGEEFNARILIMLGVTLLKTVIDIVLAALAFTETLVVVLILWRQLRSMYSLWMLCLTATKTKNICNDLTFHIATRLILDPFTNKVKYRKHYDSIRRWHRSVMKERPQYVSGTIQSIDLNIPIIIFDVTVNYLLIIIQVYVASK